jgi:gamma-glutamyltranspeptidase
VSDEILSPVRTPRGMVVTPCALASQSALAVLRDSGNAVEAMIAAAATIAIAYPHMNSIGGDGFWLIAAPGAEPIGIEACGAAAAAASIEFYRERGLSSIPFRGPMAANTVAGTIGGWAAAFNYSQHTLGGKLPLKRLLDDAIAYAREGFPVTRSQATNTASKATELTAVPGFAEAFLEGSAAPKIGAIFLQPRLAQTLERLAQAGLDDFYRGDLARTIAADLEELGSPLRLEDLTTYRAEQREPRALKHSLGMVYNMPPPTQGLVSEIIIGLLDRLLHDGMDPLGPDYVHTCVEATKLAFGVRDKHITDPVYMDVDPQSFLLLDRLDAMAAKVTMQKAIPWPRAGDPADTVWLGIIDRNGVAVSFIQSIYHESRPGCAQRAGTRSPSFPHAEPAPRALQRRPHDRLWRNGRRRPAAIAKRGLLAHRQIRLGRAGGRRSTALAARAHLGPRQRYPQTRSTLPRHNICRAPRPRARCGAHGILR